MRMSNNTKKAKPAKKPKNITVSVTLPDGLIPQINARAESLDFNRSQYFRRLAKQDLESSRTDALPEAA